MKQDIIFLNLQLLRISREKKKIRKAGWLTEDLGIEVNSLLVWNLDLGSEHNLNHSISTSDGRANFQF